jgi:transposase
LIVGIDVHKHTHTAALLDARGGELGTLRFANGPDGWQALLRWLAEHDAQHAVVGIENAAGYGRPLVGVLVAAGHAVLNVPAWRTHRDRHTSGPGKSDPGDAIAIAHVVLRKRAQLGPALEPELIRAVALLETLRRQSVGDRTQAIQRLRAIWTQVDPAAERRVAHVHRQKQLRRLKRISFGDGPQGRPPRAASARWRQRSSSSTPASPHSRPNWARCWSSMATRSPTSTAPAPRSPSR